MRLSFVFTGLFVITILGSISSGTAFAQPPGVVQEVWNNVKGGSVQSLTEEKRYSRTANAAWVLSEFAAADLGSEYGARYSALLTVPKSGGYTFWIAADDTAELWLSTDEMADNLKKIAYLNSYSNPRAWNAKKTQKSEVIQLKAGQSYFIRALHKQSGGGDHVSVVWEGPGFKQRVIDRKSLKVPQLDKRTMDLLRKTRKIENQKTKLLKMLAATPPDGVQAFADKLSRSDQKLLTEELEKLTKGVKDKPSPEVLSKMKPYFGLSAKLMPSPETPIENSVLNTLLLFEDLWIKSRSYSQLKTMGAHRTADVFGKIPAGAKTVKKTVNLNSKATKNGTEMVSTGLYAVPGKQVAVTIPKELVGKKLVLQIGHHLNSNDHNKKFVCMPRTSSRVTFDTESVKAINPYGGMLFINVPKDVELAETPVTFFGVIESPRFILGKTTDAEWKTIRNNPGPWGELVADNYILVAHREAMQGLDNPTDLMTWWSENVAAHDGFYNYNIGKPFRMHTCYNAIRGYSTWPLYESKKSVLNIMNLDRMKAYHDGLFLHEHGHHGDDGRMMFGKIGESTPNWAGYYMKGTRGDFAWKETEEAHLLRLFDRNDAHHQELFTDGWWDTKWTHHWSYPVTSMMIGYAHTFGWEAFKTCVHRFTHPDDAINQLSMYADHPAVKKPWWKVTDEDRMVLDQIKMDKWLIFLSQEAKHDVRPYFAHFHIKVSEDGEKLLDKLKLPKWDAVYNPKRRIIVSEGRSVAISSPVEDALTFSGKLTFSGFGKPSAGTISKSTNGMFTYKPKAGFTGKVSIPYAVKNVYGNEFKSSLELCVIAERANPKLAVGTVDGISSRFWKTVRFPHRYAKPVVVASIDPKANPNFITRVRNVTAIGFEIKLQQIKGEPDTKDYTAAWAVMEAGTYTEQANGMTAEAGTVASVPEPLSREAEGVVKSFGYDIPMLRSARFGQVQTVNNTNWTNFFWRDDQDNLGIRVGCHVGSGTAAARKETVGYLCLSPGLYQFDDTVVRVGKKQIESDGVILKTEFDCFNGWGFGGVERHFAKK